MFAMAVVMMILAGAAPLGQSAANLMAKAQFNSDTSALNNAVIAVATNSAMCQPTSGQPWILPANKSRNWNKPTPWGSVFPLIKKVGPNEIVNPAFYGPQGTYGVPVIVKLPFFNPGQSNLIQLVQAINSSGATPSFPQLGLPGPGTQYYSQWTELLGAEPLTVYSLRFIPNPTNTNPISPTASGATQYTVQGTLQLSASTTGSGTIATNTRTVAQMAMLVGSNGSANGCQVVNSDAFTCTEYGGMYNRNLVPKCRFGFVATNCAGSYISKLNSDGTATCAPSWKQDICPLGDAVSAIANGQVQCTKINSGTPAYFTFASAGETEAQGAGNIPLTINLSAAQTSAVSVMVSYYVTSSTGAEGTDFSVTQQNQVINFPAGSTSETYDVNVLSSGKTVPVDVLFALSNPTPNNLVVLGSPNTNKLVINAAATCPAQSTWNWIASGNSCSGTYQGSPATVGTTTPSITNTVAGFNGSATFQCTSSGWTPTGTCTPTAAPNSCAGGSGTLNVAPISCVSDLNFYAMTCGTSGGYPNTCTSPFGQNLSIGQCCVYATTARYLCPTGSHDKGISYCNSGPTCNWTLTALSYNGNPFKSGRRLYATLMKGTSSSAYVELMKLLFSRAEKTVGACATCCQTLCGYYGKPGSLQGTTGVCDGGQHIGNGWYPPQPSALGSTIPGGYYNIFGHWVTTCSPTVNYGQTRTGFYTFWICPTMSHVAMGTEQWTCECP